MNAIENHGDALNAHAEREHSECRGVVGQEQTPGEGARELRVGQRAEEKQRDRQIEDVGRQRFGPSQIEAGEAGEADETGETDKTG